MGKNGSDDNWAGGSGETAPDTGPKAGEPETWGFWAVPEDDDNGKGK